LFVSKRCQEEKKKQAKKLKKKEEDKTQSDKSTWQNWHTRDLNKKFLLLLLNTKLVVWLFFASLVFLFRDATLRSARKKPNHTN
jgi:hypothetical protein